MTHRRMSAASSCSQRCRWGRSYSGLGGGEIGLLPLGDKCPGVQLLGHIIATSVLRETVKLDSGMLVAPYFKYGISYILSIAAFCHWPTITNISPIKNFSLEKIAIF